jgi:hypothetical protein
MNEDHPRWPTAEDFAEASAERRQLEETARGRKETDPCEKGTVGCSVHHTTDSDCQTW